MSQKINHAKNILDADMYYLESNLVSILERANGVGSVSCIDIARYTTTPVEDVVNGLGYLREMGAVEQTGVGSVKITHYGEILLALHNGALCVTEPGAL